MIYILIQFLLLGFLINSDEPGTIINDDSEPDTVETGIDFEPIDYNSFKNPPFRIGEELTFKIRYGFIRAGTAKMMVQEHADSLGRNLFKFQSTARSASAFNWIYKVRDVVNSFVNIDSFYSVRFEKKLREGGYEADLFTDYYPQDSLAMVDFIRYDDGKVKKRKSYSIKVPPFVQDILSSFYYVRLKDLKVGESLYLSNHEKKKVYNLEIIVHRKEKIEVSAGTFKCIVIEPVVRGEGLFKKKGRLHVWLTDDDKKIPVQMKSELFIGSITSELIKIEGVPEPIAARVK